MKEGLKVLLALVTVLVFAAAATATEPPGYTQVARAQKASNPCGANPCAANPCAMKNVCAKNPCAANPPLRAKGIKSKAAAVKLGKKLWNDPRLGKSGLTCGVCHVQGFQLNLDKVGPFPHYVGMPNDVVTLDQMINYCMKNPMAADPLAWDSVEMTALAAYYQDLVRQYRKGAINPCSVNPCAVKMKANPCAVKNPCGANPCAANPCSMKNPCGGR